MRVAGQGGGKIIKKKKHFFIFNNNDLCYRPIDFPVGIITHGLSYRRRIEENLNGVRALAVFRCINILRGFRFLRVTVRIIM